MGNKIMNKRGSGILLPITSLASTFGIGDLGPEAFNFVDFLCATRQSYWQILPLNPTDPFHYNSPYHSCSAFACNVWLISPELLLKEGLLNKRDLQPKPAFPSSRVDYQTVIAYKKILLIKAYEHFNKKRAKYDGENFYAENANWLDDFALFKALKSKFSGKVWSDWPVEIKERQPQALEAARRDLNWQIDQEKFWQYLFHQQWKGLKNYCQEKGIKIIGDIPIYIDYDSADVWCHPELFKLDERKKPYVVSGVPPDYFSKTGQLWGNPLYQWDKMQADRYTWWIDRLTQVLNFVDIVRLDHFRGLVAYWEVPASEETAVNGRWIEAPARDFLGHLQKRFPDLPFIAEDLGTITPDVREVMKHFQLPGMKVLLFAFGSDMPTNPYVPHNFSSNCLAYTGTHDNNTVKGWFEEEASPEEKKRLFLYLGRKVPAKKLPWELIRLLMMSVANTVIIPMQDILSLGAEARMNFPSRLGGNWEWRLKPKQISPSLIEALKELTEIYARV